MLKRNQIKRVFDSWLTVPLSLWLSGREGEGERIEYYRSEALKRTSSWKGAKLHGVEKIYYQEDGTLKSEIPYKNGVRHGQAKFYTPEGHLKRETVYINGYEE